jgi:hypothetical protein
MTTRNTRTTAETPTATFTESISAFDTHEQIRRRAHDLYEQRGKQDGFADQDWFQAEAEIVGASTLKAAA